MLTISSKNHSKNVWDSYRFFQEKREEIPTGDKQKQRVWLELRNAIQKKDAPHEINQLLYFKV